MMYTRWLRHLLRRPVVWTEGGRVGAPAIEEGHSVAPQFRRSLAIRHIDTGSCNGCESEISLLGSPAYDFSRFGFSFTPSPRHADLLLVTGVVTEQMVPVLQATYDAMPDPKIVVAAGACAIDGCVFRGAPGVVGDLAQILPVAARVPGCPPSPTELLGALLAVTGNPGAAAQRQEVAG